MKRHQFTIHPQRRGTTRHAASCACGFTLIEVLAAMLIMAVVLPVALRGVSLALAAASSAKHLSEASSLAQSKLNELAVEGATGATQTSGDFMPDHPGYQWQLQSADRDYGVTELDLTVTWQERGQNKALTLTTLVLPGTTGTSDGLLGGGAS